MSDLLDIMTFLASVMSGIFISLDSVYWGDMSVLDILIALILIDGVFWFVFKLLNHSPSPDPINEEIEEWGLTDQEREDRAADRDVNTHYQKQQWTDRDDGHRDHGFEHDGAGNLRRMTTVKGDN